MEFDKKPLTLHMENLRKSQKRIMGNLNFLPLQFQYKKYYVLGLNLEERVPWYTAQLT